MELYLKHRGAFGLGSILLLIIVVAVWHEAGKPDSKYSDIEALVIMSISAIFALASLLVAVKKGPQIVLDPVALNDKRLLAASFGNRRIEWKNIEKAKITTKWLPIFVNIVSLDLYERDTSKIFGISIGLFDKPSQEILDFANYAIKNASNNSLKVGAR